MKKSKSIRLACTLLLFSVLFSGCKPETPTDPDIVYEVEEQVIDETKVTIPTVPSDPSNTPELKLTCEEARFVTLINIYRNSFQLSALSVSISGVNSSRWYSQDMISKNYFSHTEPDGRTFSERARSFGYAAWAENIAAGNNSASATFCQWKNSAGHNTNMLREQHRSMGIGNISGDGIYRTYWSNNFAGVVSDLITKPLTEALNCPMPTELPSC